MTGPLRPLAWLVMLSLAALAVALTVLSFSDPDDAAPKPVVLHANEALVEGADFSASQWFKDFSRVPTRNIRPCHVIEVRLLRRDRAFSHPFTLNFSARAFEAGVRPEGLVIAHYDELAELWTPVGSEPGFGKDTVLRCTTSLPGYYAMGVMIPFEDANQQKGDPISTGFASDFIDAPVWLFRDGRNETRRDLRLRITPSAPLVGQACAAKIAASPDALKLIAREGEVLSCRWYIVPWDKDRFPSLTPSPEDVNLGDEIPDVYSDTTEKGAFSLTIPTDAPATVLIAFAVNDPLSGADVAQAFCRLCIGAK